MSEIIFKPRHNWFKIIFIGLLFVSLGGAFVLGGYATDYIGLYILGIILGLGGLYSIARRSTLIVIGSAEIVMKRVFLPGLILEYDNFTDYTGLAFLFGNKGIPLDDMTNAKEFTDVLIPILEKRNIQSTGKYVEDVNRTNKALKYAIIPSIVITFAITYILGSYTDIDIDGRLVNGIVFIISLFVIYFILKKIEEFNKG